MSESLLSLSDITEDKLNKVSRPLEEAYTLPADAYINDAVYAQEVKRIMRSSWIPVARLEQLPEQGSYLTLDLVGQPVVVARGGDNQVRVMSNVCLHRSATLAQGCGISKRFRCPYHAWTYDNKGQLLRAPLMQDSENFDEKTMQLPQIRSEVWNGFVMANLDSDAAAFAPQVEGFAQYFANFQLNDMEIVRTLEYDSHWNWKVLVENFMEAYHHIAIHSETFQPSHPARESRILDNSGPWSILHMPAKYAPNEPITKAMPGQEEAQNSDLFAGVIFPYFLLAFQSSGVVWYQVLPSAADRLLLKIHLMVPAQLKTMDGFDAALDALAAAVDVIHQEDIGANDLVWRGLKAPMTQQGRLSPLEKSIWQLNQWWLEKMR